MAENVAFLQSSIFLYDRRSRAFAFYQLGFIYSEGHVSGTRYSKGTETFRARRQILNYPNVSSSSTVLAHKPVNFASFTDSFVVSLSIFLKL